MADSHKPIAAPAPEPVNPYVPPDEPEDAPLTGRQRAWLVVRVILKRVRFFAILAAVGALIVHWDRIKTEWDRWTHPRAVASRELAADQEFFCPMHPNVVRSSYEPNGSVPNCPLCGMPLSLRKKGEKEKLPDGITARVQLSPERIQMAGVETVAVEYRPMARQTVTVGYVAFDESRQSRVVSRVAGYVEKLYVDKTFATVREGDPLAEIYSPDLYSTARELLMASRPGVSADLAQSSRKRLKLLGVGDQEIDEIVRSGAANPRLVIRSPQSGYVTAKKVVVGASVEMGMTLLEVADLSKVWIEADVYEKDVPYLAVGQKVEATVEAFPNRVFAGQLALVVPQLDATTRTNRIRFELENPGHELRPGMFATVRINTPLDNVEPFRSLARKGTAATTLVSSGGATPRVEVLAVPERAVVDTGAKKIVYVERMPGIFEGVEVQLGPRVELEVHGRKVDYYPIVQGLQPGDRVVAAGAFLIDAETRLNPAAASGYFGAMGTQQDRAAPSGPKTPGATKPEPPKPLRKPSEEERNHVAELPEEDRAAASAQTYCPIRNLPLGSMGVPYKLTLQGKTVFLCCKGCVGQAKREPEETLKRVEEFLTHAVP
jgi:Cu(I)/Ag(I) efflux system membrane fusion protein